MFSKIYDNIKKFIKENFAFLIICIAILLIYFVKLPYQVEMPGGIIPLDNRVLIDGKETDTKGSFNMAYVSVAQGNIPYIVLGLLMPDWDVVANKDITYENETIEEANKRDKLNLEQSKNNATVAALKAAEIPYEISNKKNQILYIASQAKTTLEIGDAILSVDGNSFEEIEDIKRIVQQKEVGESVLFEIERDGKTKEAVATIYDEKDEKLIGISTLTLFDIICDVDIKIDTKKSESGPSGGLMMSLILYNALTNQDLTHGKTIVGTGTIDKDGKVGAIGGVKYKIMGAYKNKADIFLVPEDNYAEAMEVNEEKGYNLTIVSVSTLKDAVLFLEGLDE